MDLNRGRHLTAIPGPSVIPDRVLRAMHVAMPNIYEGRIVEVGNSLFADLPRIARGEGQAFVAISNGHGAWEMALTNVLSRGEKVLVLESGLFAAGWGSQAEALGARVERLAAPPGEPVDPDQVEEVLRQDRGQDIRAVLVVQIDTGSGVWNDIAALRRAMDAAGHPALLMVDAIASLGCVPYEMDAWGVDVTVGASQKGLMTPPGLGLVWAGGRAIAAHREADMRTPYWDWSGRMPGGDHYTRYAGTPPVQHLYALREALDMILGEGLEAVWDRHRAFATAVRAAVEAWSTREGLGFNVQRAAHRADTTTTVRTGGFDAGRLREICERDCGLTLGIGLGHAEGSAFRIGHMGHLNPPMVLGTIATVESALRALRAPVGGSGIDAATRVISAAIGS